jgi:hypothetical protein
LADDWRRFDVGAFEEATMSRTGVRSGVALIAGVIALSLGVLPAALGDFLPPEEEPGGNGGCPDPCLRTHECKEPCPPGTIQCNANQVGCCCKNRLTGDKSCDCHDDFNYCTSPPNPYTCF